MTKAGPELPESADRQDMPRLACPVVLIGLMGAGKSSVGLKLANLLKADFIDSDDEIEKAANLSVSEIFERYGEEHFRMGERRVLARLLAGPPMIIATGGGAFMDPETRALVQDCALSIWLRAELDVLVHRTAGRGHRPLLKKGNPREILARLIGERYPVYAKADLTIDSFTDQTQEQMAVRIGDALLQDGRAFGKAAP